MSIDKVQYGLVTKMMPRFNDVVCNGLATVQIPKAMQYVDQLFMSVKNIFPAGLEYHGGIACTPEEEFQHLVGRGNTSLTTIELARKDMYLARFSFTLHGEKVEDRYLYLPFVERGGIITIRGARFAISPLLTDISVSVGTDDIFIPVNQARITYRRRSVPMGFVRNEKIEFADVIWSRIHRRDGKKSKDNGAAPAVKAETCMMHYLLCKYGLTEAFRRFRGVTIVAGDETTINADTYPPSEWSICSVTGGTPPGVKDRHYMASRLRLAVPNIQYDFVVASMIASVFHIVEYFPQRVLPEYVDELNLWRILLGMMVFPEGTNEGRLDEGIRVHLETVDEYLDGPTRKELEEDGIHVKDIYELFMWVIENFNPLITTSGSKVASLRDKRLSVLKYALYDIREAIYMMSYALKSKAKKRLLIDDVKKIMRYHLKPDLATRMNTGHGEVSSIAYPGDCMIFKITSTLVPQSNSSGSNKKRGKASPSMSDPAKLLHSTVAEVGSHSNISKADPSGRSRINPYLNAKESGEIVYSTVHRELLDSVELKIKR